MYQFIMGKGFHEGTPKSLTTFLQCNNVYTVKRPGIIEFFPARESMVSDIPAEDGNIANFFLHCMCGIGASVLCVHDNPKAPCTHRSLKMESTWYAPTPFCASPPPRLTPPL